MFSRVLLYIGLIICMFVSMAAFAGQYSQAVFYKPKNYGSEALFNPMASFLSYTLDSLQIKESFHTSNYSKNFDIVKEDLLHPGQKIDETGGIDRFINTEIFPINAHDLDESKALLPNYGLHLFGGGMLFRKNGEWFAEHNVPMPFLTSAIISMVTEILAEPLEKPVTDSTDEIADVYLFRPLGIWLFSDAKRAQWIKEQLDPIDWPHMMMYDLAKDELLNIGISYVIRPHWLARENQRLFAYFGISNLFGLSHRLDSGDELSWGLGVSTISIKPTSIRGSAGIFYDRDNSLLGSLIINGAENLKLRANIYPGALLTTRAAKLSSVGLFLGLSDDNKIAFGLQYGLPIGLGATF